METVDFCVSLFSTESCSKSVLFTLRPSGHPLDISVMLNPGRNKTKHHSLKLGHLAAGLCHGGLCKREYCISSYGILLVNWLSQSIMQIAHLIFLTSKTLKRFSLLIYIHYQISQSTSENWNTYNVYNFSMRSKGNRKRRNWNRCRNW